MGWPFGYQGACGCNCAPAGISICGCSGIPTTLNWSTTAFSGGPYTGTATWSPTIPTVNACSPVGGAWWSTCVTFTGAGACSLGNPCGMRVALFCDQSGGFRVAYIFYFGSQTTTTSPGASPGTCVATVGSGSFACLTTTPSAFTCSPFFFKQGVHTFSAP